MGRKPAHAGPEYRLFVTPRFNDRRHAATTLFLLETTKHFASFRYELSVDVAVTHRTLTFRVLGLKAPNLSLPAAGHARYAREFDGLRGTYEVTVEGLNGKSSSFSVSISDKKVHILQSPARTFVDLIVDPNRRPAD